MKKITFKLLIILTLMLASACSFMETKIMGTNDHAINRTLVANGYSKRSMLPQLTQQQNRLATEQAAKINAYRVLAKQLYNVQLAEGLWVANQVISDEIYRVYLDLYMREAKVITSKNIADQKKITLQLSLTPRFYQCISTTVSIVRLCLQEDNKIPFTRIGYQQAAMSTVNLSCASSDCSAQLVVSGFSKEKHILDRAMLDVGLYDSEWTANMAVKTIMHYLFLSEHIFN